VASERAQNGNSKLQIEKWKFGLVRPSDIVRSTGVEQKAKIEATKPKKCGKMRFEATTLLKTKEVDLERTQIRSQFQAFFRQE